MGVERLRKLLDIETGIITGETSGSVKKRAEKLQLKFLYLGIKDKKAMFNQILTDTGFHANQIGYIGDDVNDLEIMRLCGFTACPEDAMEQVKKAVDYVCVNSGGYGAFREFAELIIQNKK